MELSLYSPNPLIWHRPKGQWYIVVHFYRSAWCLFWRHFLLFFQESLVYISKISSYFSSMTLQSASLPPVPLLSLQHLSRNHWSVACFMSLSYLQYYLMFQPLICNNEAAVLFHQFIVLSYTCTVETLYNTVNFCWSTHKRHSIARPKGRGMGCLLWVQRATYCVDLSKLSSIKYLL